jgi:hypothetical protein
MNTADLFLFGLGLVAGFFAAMAWMELWRAITERRLRRKWEEDRRSWTGE